MDLHVRLADSQRLVCRVPAGSIECDREIDLYVDMSETSVFAADELNP